MAGKAAVVAAKAATKGIAAFAKMAIAAVKSLAAAIAAGGWVAVAVILIICLVGLIEVAVSQLGNPGGQPYWSWYGYSCRVEWCACFVSWCENEVSYIEAGLAPKFSWCQAGIAWFSDAGQYQPHGTVYTPQSGDIIFFDWDGAHPSDHVGIVESCDGSVVYTIEGNSSDAVNRRSYNINSSSILGYGQIRS